MNRKTIVSLVLVLIILISISASYTQRFTKIKPSTRSSVSQSSQSSVTSTPPLPIRATLQQNTSQETYACPTTDKWKLNNEGHVPDFLLIGVAKGGTTSFSQYLPSHPNIMEIHPKEPNFWSWKYIEIERYQQMFVNKEPLQTRIPEGSHSQIAGEYTTSYILHPLVPKRVATQLPTVKVIMLLRNPIDRAYSHYIMSTREKLESYSFEKIIAQEFEEIDELRFHARVCFNSDTCNIEECFPRIPLRSHSLDLEYFNIERESHFKDYFYQSYLYRSIYDDSVERWLAVFPREQVLILKSEDLFDNPAAVLDEVVEFLGVPKFDFNSTGVLDKFWGGGASNVAQQPHEYEPMKNSTRELLSEFFRPYNERLYKIIGRDMGWD